MIYVLLIAAIVLITAVALGVPWLDDRRHQHRQRDPDLDAAAGLIVTAAYGITGDWLPAPLAACETTPPPMIVPGQGISPPARPAAPLAAATATPPAVPGGADAATLAGGSSPPAGEPQEAPGTGALPPGDVPDLPGHLLTWLTVQAHKTAIMAELENEPARSAIKAAEQ